MARALDERYDRLYRQLWRPARAMVRRAFGSAFSEEEIEDVYGNAWLGTLRALASRDQLSDEELRKYVLTAVANHASKELRRRGRRPVAPLDDARRIPDTATPPDERAAQREQSRIARDVLATLPPRRRAVLLFRYGWGLDPEQVCGLVKGLSPRAYRKEITRGVDEVATKLRLVEEGRWCGDREQVLNAYAAGIADEEQRRQAEQHLAHCRHCADYVGKVSAHLHELGASIAWTGAADAIDGHASLVDHVGAGAERAREVVTGLTHRGGDVGDPATSQLVSTGSARGGSAAAAGVLAKAAGLGAAGKITAACVGTGIAATACVAAGVVPSVGPDSERKDRPALERDSGARLTGAAIEIADRLPSAVAPSPSQAAPGGNARNESVDLRTNGAATSAPALTPAPSAPPAEQEFGAVGAASDTGSFSGGGGSGGGAGSAVQHEFGP